MGTLTERVLKDMSDRQKKVLSGQINCIPFPFPRFREVIPGIEKECYTIVTGATKSAKTQLATFLYIYYPILYAYFHPDLCRVKVLYFPLEETPEKIVTRFMAYLLFYLSKGKYRISPTNLRSTNKDRPLQQEILDILHSQQYQKILTFFEEHVIFSNATNPTGVWKTCKNYAEENGTVHSKSVKYTDEFGQTQVNTEAFDWYEMNDPDEYRIIFFDHASLVNTEKGQTLREAIQKLSEYLVILRNRYKFSPVLIQQQAMYENLDAYKMEKLEPSITNLADNKATSRDCNVCLSIFSPFRYGKSEYAVGQTRYDISLFRDHFRTIECLLYRDGEMNGKLPLYFDGACAWFEELPKPIDTAGTQRIVNKMQRADNNKTGILFLTLIQNLHGRNQITKEENRSEELQP